MGKTQYQNGTDSVGQMIREVRRRSRVIGIFLTIDSWVRLETCYLIEYLEDWQTNRSYIKREKIQEAMEHNRNFLAAQAAS